mgnify:CR=1 FL=1
MDDPLVSNSEEKNFYNLYKILLIYFLYTIKNNLVQIRSQLVTNTFETQKVEGSLYQEIGEISRVFIRIDSRNKVKGKHCVILL